MGYFCDEFPPGIFCFASVLYVTTSQALINTGNKSPDNGL